MDTTTFATAATSDEELAVEESIAAFTTGDIDFDNLDSTEDLPSHTTKDELMGDINQTKADMGATNMGDNGLQQINGYTPLPNSDSVRGEGENILLPTSTTTAGEKISDVLSHTKDINPPYTQGKTPKVGGIMGSDNGGRIDNGFTPSNQVALKLDTEYKLPNDKAPAKVSPDQPLPNPNTPLMPTKADEVEPSDEPPQDKPQEEPKDDAAAISSTSDTNTASIGSKGPQEDEWFAAFEQWSKNKRKPEEEGKQGAQASSQVAAASAAQASAAQKDSIDEMKATSEGEKDKVSAIFEAAASSISPVKPVSKRQSLLAEKSGSAMDLLFAAVEAQPAVKTAPTPVKTPSNHSNALPKMSSKKTSPPNSQPRSEFLNFGGDSPSDNTGRWTSEEHEAFVSAYQMYGKDWKKVAAVVKTRSIIQTRTHAQKYILKLQKKAASSNGRYDLGSFSLSTSQKSDHTLQKKVSAAFRAAEESGPTRSMGWSVSSSTQKAEKRGPKKTPQHVKSAVSKKAAPTVLDEETAKMLSDVFYNIHGNKKEISLSKKMSKPDATSIYNGVHLDLSKKTSTKFEARFSKFRLGSYTLETDAALAYDAAIRARGLEKHYEKINFTTQNKYLKARDVELKSLKIKGIDLAETLAFMGAYVNKVYEFAASEAADDLLEQEEPDSQGTKESTMLYNLFYNIHGSERGLVTKKTNKKKSTSNYNGVYVKRAKPNHQPIFEVQFSTVRLGYYSLEADAALAYDAAIRARGIEKHYEKINFNTQNKYLKARKIEAKKKSLEDIELGETLEYITSYVSKVSELALLDEQDEPDSQPKSSVVVPPKKKAVVGETSKMLKVLFANDHGLEEVELVNTKSKHSSSRYNGVYAKELKHENKYEVQFCGVRLGVYILQADAALAYDSAIRARGEKEHSHKINFASSKDYLAARKVEAKSQSTNVDLEEALAFIMSKIEVFQEAQEAQEEEPIIEQPRHSPRKSPPKRSPPKDRSVKFSVEPPKKKAAVVAVSEVTSNSKPELAADLVVLPSHLREKKASGHPLCKIKGCDKQGRSEKDDMCKSHYNTFKMAGRNTKETGEEVKSQLKSDDTVLFPTKLMTILQKEDKSIISWVDGGNAFIIRDSERMGGICAQYFKHNQVKSFQRSLSQYGFKRISFGINAGAYQHDLFKKGQKPSIIAQIKAIPRGTTSSVEDTAKKPATTTSSRGRVIQQKPKFEPSTAPTFTRKVQVRVEGKVQAKRPTMGNKRKPYEKLNGTPRGITQRPSGKWQVQIYYAGTSRYIGVFMTKDESLAAYKAAKECAESFQNDDPSSPQVNAHLKLMRKAAYSLFGSKSLTSASRKIMRDDKIAAARARRMKHAQVNQVAVAARAATGKKKKKLVKSPETFDHDEETYARTAAASESIEKKRARLHEFLTGQPMQKKARPEHDLVAASSLFSLNGLQSSKPSSAGKTEELDTLPQATDTDGRKSGRKRTAPKFHDDLDDGPQLGGAYMPKKKKVYMYKEISGSKSTKANKRSPVKGQLGRPSGGKMPRGNPCPFCKRDFAGGKGLQYHLENKVCQKKRVVPMEATQKSSSLLGSLFSTEP